MDVHGGSFLSRVLGLLRLCLHMFYSSFPTLHYVQNVCRGVLYHTILQDCDPVGAVRNLTCCMYPPN